MNKQLAKDIQSQLCAICDSKAYAVSVLEDIKATLKEWDSMRLSEVHTIKDVIELIDKHIEGVNK